MECVCYRWRSRRALSAGSLGKQSLGREDLRGHAKLSDIPAKQQKIHRTVPPGGQVESQSNGRRSAAVRDDRQQELRERRRKSM